MSIYNTETTLLLKKQIEDLNIGIQAKVAANDNIQKTIQERISNLNRIFDQVEIKNGVNQDFFLVKKNVFEILQKKTSFKEQVEFLSITTKVFEHLQRESSTEVLLSALKQLRQEPDFKAFRTDEEVLKATKAYEKILKLLQKSRLNLLKEGSLQGHEKVALIKRLCDLEERLKHSDMSAIQPFLELALHCEIDLSKTLIMKIKDGNQGANPAFYVFNAPLEGEKSMKVAIFKPINTKSQIANPAIPTGKSASRQIAAYLLDKINGGKVGVPLTIRAHAKRQMGTIQVYKEHLSFLANLTEEPHLLSAKDLHLLTIHGLRLWNIDANLKNILWKLDEKGNVRLTFIDHDDCLPVFSHKSLLMAENTANLSWSDFPQMDLPFDEGTKRYIESLNPDQEAKYLIELGFPIESINLLKTLTWFIQAAVKNDLLPGEIYDYLLFGPASVMDDMSLIEQMIKVQDSLKSNYPDPLAKDDALYAQSFEKEIKAVIQKKLKEIQMHIDQNGSPRRGSKELTS